MTTILQVSDTHLAPPGTLVFGFHDTLRSARRLVARILDVLPRIAPVDALLVSGDLSDAGDPDSYELFRSIFAPIGVPIYVLPGNHDRREALRQAFLADGYLPARGRLNWQARIGAVHVIGLDTLIEGAAGGVLDGATLRFLSAALKEAGDAPVLLALHHPPFSTGMDLMDGIGLDGAEALGDLLRKTPNDVLVVCGHIHNTMMARIGTKPVISAPSPGFGIRFDRRADVSILVDPQGDGFLLHRWEGAFVSARIPPEGGPVRA